MKTAEQREIDKQMESFKLKLADLMEEHKIQVIYYKDEQIFIQHFYGDEEGFYNMEKEDLRGEE